MCAQLVPKYFLQLDSAILCQSASMLFAALMINDCAVSDCLLFLIRLVQSSNIIPEVDATYLVWLKVNTADDSQLMQPPAGRGFNHLISLED